MSIGTIAVTGATGFIGSHLLEGLIDSGYMVVAFHRHRSPEHLRQHCRLSWVNIEEMEACFGRNCPDAVIHLATSYGSGVSFAEIVASNVSLPLRLLELAISQGCPLFVNTDSFFAKPEFNYSHMRPYIQSKNHFMHWVALAMEEKPAIKVVNARLEHVYGSGDGEKKFIPYLLAKLFANDTVALTKGEQLRDFVHVEDVVSAYLTIVKSAENLLPGPTEVQVGTGTAHSVRTFVEMAKEVSGSTSRLDFGALPYRNREIMCSVADSAALRALGWTPSHTLATGIRATLDAKPLHHQLLLR